MDIENYLKQNGYFDICFISKQILSEHSIVSLYECYSDAPMFVKVIEFHDRIEFYDSYQELLSFVHQDTFYKKIFRKER